MIEMRKEYRETACYLSGNRFFSTMKQGGGASDQISQILCNLSVFSFVLLVKGFSKR